MTQQSCSKCSLLLLPVLCHSTLEMLHTLWGGLHFPLPIHLVLPVPAPFLSGSCLCVLFLIYNLQNIVQCRKIHFLFLPAPALLGIPSPPLFSPATLTFPAPITPTFLPPFPPSHCCIQKIILGWTQGATLKFRAILHHVLRHLFTSYAMYP